MSQMVDRTANGLLDKRTSDYRTRAKTATNTSEKQRCRAAPHGHAHCTNVIHEVDTPDPAIRKQRALEGVGPWGGARSGGALRGLQLRGVADATADAPGGQHPALHGRHRVGSHARPASSRDSAAA